jgi:predicted O-linked N-acetylglucosamine transferase (SPINDLY family)
LDLAKGAVLRGEQTLASHFFGRVLENDDRDLAATLGLAASQLMLGKGSTAEELAQRALTIAPNNPDARLILANIRIAQERYQEAMTYLREAITVDPSFSLGFSRLGTILTALGENAKAEPILLRALALNPTDTNALNSIGNVAVANGDPKGATLHFERAIAANPGWLQPRINLAKAFDHLDCPDDAIGALEDLLTQDPSHLEAKAYLASLLNRVGNFGRALHLLGNILEAKPEHLEALFLAGLIHLKGDQPDEAIEYLERAAALAPGSADVKLNLVAAYRSTKRLDKALTVARRAVKSGPDHAPTLNALGSVLLDLMQHNEAAEMFRQATAIDPGFYIAHVNLATALLAAQRPTDAIKILEQAVNLGAPPEAVLGTFGIAYRDLGKLKESESNLRRAIHHDPEDSNALYTLASVFEMSGRKFDAHPIATALIAQDPGLVHAHVVQAVTEKDEAAGLAAIGRAFALAPDNIQVNMVAGTLNDSAFQPAEALRHYCHALELEPNNEKAKSRRADIILSLCNFTQRDKLVREFQLTSDGDNEATGLDIFNLQAIDLSYDAIAKAAKLASETLVQHLEADASDLWVPCVASKSDRIRIGYLLPYTWFHSLPMVLRHIVESHDRDRFEIVGFAMHVGKLETPFEQSYKAAFDSFHNLVGLTPRQAAARIGAEGIDILIEVSGHTSITCLPIAAYRPAPVQVHLLGYSITTGASFIDYLITDEIYIPRNQAAMGSEAVVYMPHSFMPALAQPVAKGTTRRAELNLPDDAFVLANFNHPCKFEPVIFDAWIAILKRVPNAIMWFGHWFEETSANLRHEAEARGIAGKRLIFAPIVEHAEHLRRLTKADLAVDNRLHGGGITTIDALQVGLPVLTVVGPTPSSRLGATLLNGIGTPDMVASSLDDYVEKAVAFACNPGALVSVRDRLEANRETTPLFDFKRYVRDLERAYEAIWQRHQDGMPPALIDLKKDT